MSIGLKNSPFSFKTPPSTINRFYAVKYNMCVAPGLPLIFKKEMEILFYLTSSPIKFLSHM